MAIDPSKPLKPLAAGWIEKIRLAQKRKKQHFGDDAKSIMRFYNGKSSDFWSDENLKSFVVDNGDFAMPTFRMVVNKAFEFKSLYGPSLYYQNPNRVVEPRRLPELPPELFVNPMDPMAGQQLMLLGQVQQQDALRRAGASALMGTVLNYLPGEQDAKAHMRLGIDEALLKGMGVWWTEEYQPPGYQGKLVGTFWQSCDDLVWDPDGESWLDGGIQWVARRCVHPVWEVERDYPHLAGKLKGNLESIRSQGETVEYDDAQWQRQRGESNDLLCYWKVYSKMGAGARLTGVSPELKGTMEELGDYCYLVVADGVEEPLNLPVELALTGQVEQIVAAVQWPIPFWIDGGWPCSVLGFHWSPDNPYPISPLRPGLGELKFLNWAMSYLAGKVKTTSRDFIALLKQAESTFKKQIQQGEDLTVLEFDGESHQSVAELVQFLQHPPMNKDLYSVIEAVATQFDKRVGLSDLMYGIVETQDRSATMSSVRASSAQIRPDDMATITDAVMTEIAGKEAFAAYWLLEGRDVAPIVGQVNAMLWDQLVRAQPPEQIAREYDYRIEAGSARRPNKDTKIAQMNQALQTLGPVLSQVAGAGQVGPWNALASDWANANDLDPTPYMIQPMLPPPVAGPPSE